MVKLYQTFGRKELGITDTNRIKQTMDWFFNTVFQDEKIFPRQQEPSEPVPPLLRAARSLETGMPASHQSRESIFTKQATLLTNYEDSYVYDQPVLRYYPTYQSLTDPELRGYFSWRTKVRGGDVRKTSLSYAFLYIYELLNQIGVSDPMDGYRKLKDFQAVYGAQDRAILPYLNRWLMDYVVYYGLDPALLADTPQVVFDKHLAVLASIGQHEPQEIMEAVAALSGRWLERSKFYGAYRADMDAVTVRVLRRVAAHYDQRCKKTMVEQYFGVYSEFPIMLFESAVFHNRKRIRNRDLEVDAVRSYHCRNGLWTIRKYACPERPSAKLGDLVKTVDSVMRECYVYRHPIQRELETKWLVKIIEEETRGFLSERQAAQAKRITIDYSQLAKIRQDAAVTQDRLIVEEEAMEAGQEPETPESQAPENGASKREAPENGAPEGESPETPLTPEEYRLLQCLLYGRDLGWVRASGLMLSVLVDGINEKLFDEFADSVLTLDSQPELIGDYIQDLKEMVHP